MDIEINDVAKYGVVQDTPGYMVPPEAWTTGMNMLVIDNGVERQTGWEQLFGTPGVAPHFAMPVRTASQTFWAYMGTQKIYVWDGTNHTDLTRTVGGNYSVSATETINGTTLGGIPIINNGVDVPQYWPALSIGTHWADLTAWTSGMKAKILRAFGPFLIGFNITKGSDHYPHMIKWSTEADPGTLPSTWDETDATHDAGEIELSDALAGTIQEAWPLNEIMYVYKENSCWKLRFVGGRDIFDPGQAAWLNTGILAARCVATTGDGKKHVVATQDDIIWHDGNSVQSVLTQKQRRRLFNEIDTQTYGTSFMFDDPVTRHMYFCYPSSGASQPNKAVVMFYGGGDDMWPVFEMDGVTFRNVAIGPIEGAEDDTWEADELTWEDDEAPWSVLARRRLVACGVDATKFYGLSAGTTRDGISYTGTLQRVALAVLGKKRDGSWIVDWDHYKQFDAVWPKLQGLPVSIRLGTQLVVDGAVTWTSAITYTPGTDTVCYPGPVSGYAGAIEFSSSSHFRLDGYILDVTDLGTF